MKKLLSLMLALTLILSALPMALASAEDVPYYQVTSDLYDFYPQDGDPIRLEVYSQLANYNGLQTGWGATLMKDMFNVELVIIPDSEGT